MDSLRYSMAEGLRLYACVSMENHMHLVASSGRCHAGAWERDGKNIFYTLYLLIITRGIYV